MSTPRVKLSLQPVPRSLVRVAVAGEFLKNMGMLDDAEIRSVQQAVAEGLVAQLIVLGVNSASIGKERFTLRFDPMGNDDTIHLDLSDGKSTTEALDTGFAGAVAYSVQLLKRRSLKPKFFIIWSPQALADKPRLEAACRRLNLTMDAGPMPAFSPDSTEPSPPAFAPLPAPMPSLPPLPMNPSYSLPLSTYMSSPPRAPDNYVYKEVLSVKPAKEPGITYTIETAVKKK